MPIRRVGRPGLIGLAARTAVVAGTASAVSGAMSNNRQRKQQSEYEQQQYQAAQQQAAMHTSRSSFSPLVFASGPSKPRASRCAPALKL